MKFSIFKTAKAQRGELCTYEKFLEVTSSAEMARICKEIAAEEDHDKRSELKKQLPVVTWQAFFEGRRVSKEAHPSGLFMLDIDHVEDPYDLYSKNVAGRCKELGIVFAGMTASTHGLRLVAKCLPTLHSIEECQRWLASNLKVECDEVCKDWARCSFLVHESYTYFMDAKSIWCDDPAEGIVYAGGLNPVQVNAEMEEALQDATPSDQPAKAVDQREGLFGGITEYRGIPLETIAKEWLMSTGGMPEPGERNARLYKCALRMRYLTEFNPATMLRVLPDCGLPEEERKTLIQSALSTTRAGDIPNDIRKLVERLEKQRALTPEEQEDEEMDFDVNKLPPLPPVINEMVSVAPKDFKQAVILTHLPVLGALGSKLRAKYLDNQMHSPSFIVALEAPQASGKSFMQKLVETELAQMLEHDEEEREKELEYEKKIKEMRMLNIKVTPENKDQVLGTQPQTLVRYVPPTMSVTKLLMRMKAAQGLHLFAFAPEVDTVTKAFKRGFSSYSDLLRVAFDNGLHGQDYASENSFSGVVQLYYNFLCSGTPKAMRRFFPDVEDGLVSRVAFINLPDQFGKPMPVWEELDKKQKAIVDTSLVRLNEITLQGDEVQPDHVMKLTWLNKALEEWIRKQQAQAVKENDRTRDIFCRRAAVVGFRAGMLAFFLYNEKRTPTIMRKVIEFSKWVASFMLSQHILRFNINNAISNTNPWNELYEVLPKKFTRAELEKEMTRMGIETNVKVVVYKWRLQGLITPLEYENRGKRDLAITFEKNQ